MTFREAEEYLLGLELFGMRFGLDRVNALLASLGRPTERLERIHVVGTNGKSSTVRFAAAILERHGLRSGSYTSPHLRSFRERVEVGERPISEEAFAAAVSRAAGAAREVERARPNDDRVTQFEALTAAAFLALADGGVEAAAIEAGLGGRYDATNVVGSRVVVLTGVDLEHTRWLGDTVAEIAEEKLAVVRGASTLVVGEDLDSDARAVAERVAREQSAALVTAEPADDRVPLRALGEFQRRNLALARAAVTAFLGRDPDADVVRGAAADTAVPGRLEVVGESPLTLYDGAHNPAGARALAAALPGVLAGRPPPVLVLSVLEDKDADGLLDALLPLCGRVILTECANPRALDAERLRALVAGRRSVPAEVVKDPRAALARAREAAGESGAVLATGSIYLIADLVRKQGGSRASSL